MASSGYFLGGLPGISYEARFRVPERFYKRLKHHHIPGDSSWHATCMLQCSQPSLMPAGYVQDGFPQQRSWSDRTGTKARRHGLAEFPAVKPQSVDATDRGRRSFVAHNENRNTHTRLYRRAETLPRGLY